MSSRAKKGYKYQMNGSDKNQAKILSEFKTESQPNAYIHISIRCVFLRIVLGRKHYCVLKSPLNDM